ECMSPESLTGVPCPSAPRGETARGKEFASFFFFKTNWTYQARSARDMRARRCACPRLSGRCRVGLHQAHSIHPGHPDLITTRASCSSEPRFLAHCSLELRGSRSFYCCFMSQI